MMAEKTKRGNFVSSRIGYYIHKGPVPNAALLRKSFTVFVFFSASLHPCG